MISDEEAREAVENMMASLKKLNEYCGDRCFCSDCQFRGEYEETIDEYVCDLRMKLMGLNF